MLPVSRALLYFVYIHRRRSLSLSLSLAQRIIHRPKPKYMETHWRCILWFNIPSAWPGTLSLIAPAGWKSAEQRRFHDLFFLICVRVELLSSLFSTQERLFICVEMRTGSGGDATGVQFKKPPCKYMCWFLPLLFPSAAAIVCDK